MKRTINMHQKRVIKTILMPAILAAMLGICPKAQPAGLTVGWSTCNGGGGSCAAGKFKMNCAVGQPITGVVVGNTYAGQGGFLPAFQKPVLPPLTMVRTRTEYLLTWPDVAEGLHLDWTQDLNSASWADLGEGTLVGAQRQARIPAFNANLFFRLRKDCPK